VTRLGITGHQFIPAAAQAFIAGSLNREIDAASGDGPVWGITSLAVGADQLFAELVIRKGGKLHVVLPSLQYETTFDTQRLTRFRSLLALASEVEELNFEGPNEAAFFAAGKRVVDLCDSLLAVWDSRPSRGLGGTGAGVR
jgi:hypothetical protein